MLFCKKTILGIMSLCMITSTLGLTAKSLEAQEQAQSRCCTTTNREVNQQLRPIMDLVTSLTKDYDALNSEQIFARIKELFLVDYPKIFGDATVFNISDYGTQIKILDTKREVLSDLAYGMLANYLYNANVENKLDEAESKIDSLASDVFWAEETFPGHKKYIYKVLEAVGCNKIKRMDSYILMNNEE